MQGEFWLLRQCPSVSEPCDEELYVNGHVVVWSRGSSETAGAVQVLRCFTTDTPVLEVSFSELCVINVMQSSHLRWSMKGIGITLITLASSA